MGIESGGFLGGVVSEASTGGGPKVGKGTIGLASVIGLAAVCTKKGIAIVDEKAVLRFVEEEGKEAGEALLKLLKEILDSVT